VKWVVADCYVEMPGCNLLFSSVDVEQYGSFVIAVMLSVMVKTIFKYTSVPFDD
jgi:hypothetical protein